MGDRINIAIKYEDGDIIYFYSHWRGLEIKNVLKKALKRGEVRWNDEPYLTRIIFSEMIKDEVMEVTGYGIAPYPIDDGQNKTIEVNIKKQTVDGQSFENFIK